LSIACAIAIAVATGLALLRRGESKEVRNKRIYEGKNVILVGCQKGGIGEKIAKILRGKKVNLFLVDLNDSVLGIAEGLGDGTTGLVQDMTKDGAAETVIKAAVRHFKGKIDGLIMMQVYMPKPGFVSLLNAEVMQRAYDVAMKASILMTLNALPFIEESKGTIAFASSGSVAIPLPMMGMYRAVKVAMQAWLETLYQEQIMKNTGVKVSIVSFSAIKTGLYHESVQDVGFGDDGANTAEEGAEFFVDSVFEKSGFIHLGPLPILSYLPMLVPLFPSLFRYSCRRVVQLQQIVWDRDKECNERRKKDMLGKD